MTLAFGRTTMILAELQREAHAIAKEGSFAELQEQAGLALAWQDIEGARAAIKAMKEFVAMAERDLEKLGIL